MNAMDKKTKSKSIHISFLWLKIVVPVCLAAVVGFGAWYGYRQFTFTKIQKLHDTVYSEIKQVAEFTVLKNNYSDVVSLKKNAVGGLVRSYSIVKFNGVIRVGVEDMSRMDISISKDGSAVTVRIPHSQILDNSITDLKAFDEKTSIFVPIKMEEVFEEIRASMKDTQDNLLASGILDAADKRTEELITAMLKMVGFSEIKVVYSGR